MTETPDRALTFGAAAADYERFRPGYPEAVFDAVREYAGRPLATALGIGAGTGKATRLFAAHGVRVTATEPDAAMLAELRRVTPAAVSTRQASLETLPPGARFDLVYAAAALHWTRAEGRWERVSGFLAPGGVFASFGGPVELADPNVADAVRRARAPFLRDDDVPSPDGTAREAPMQWPGTELRRTDLFDDVRQVLIERRLTLTAAGYLGYLSTVSAYLQLDPALRARALGAVEQALPPDVEIVADVVAHLARSTRRA